MYVDEQSFMKLNSVCLPNREGSLRERLGGWSGTIDWITVSKGFENV